MKIGILQTGRSPEGLREKHGDYDAMFRRFLGGRGLEFATYAALDGELPEDVRDADGWLITGSKFGVYEDHAWIRPFEDFLLRAYGAHVPIVGVCFGHQILAQALGGAVEKFSGGWSVGGEAYDLDGVDGKARLLAWHQDQVVAIPEDARVAGSSPFCRYAALAYGDRAYSIQAHPEFSPEFFGDLLEARGEVLPKEIERKAARSFDGETSSDRVAELVDAFFRQPRTGA